MFQHFEFLTSVSIQRTDAALPSLLSQRQFQFHRQIWEPTSTSINRAAFSLHRWGDIWQPLFMQGKGSALCATQWLVCTLRVTCSCLGDVLDWGRENVWTLGVESLTWIGMDLITNYISCYETYKFSSYRTKSVWHLCEQILRQYPLSRFFFLLCLKIV